MKAFIVALPVTDPGGANDISANVPARFQHITAGEWNVLFNEQKPNMQPNGRGTVRGKPRRSDTRHVVYLRAIAAHVGQSMGAFVCVSPTADGLAWAKAKADGQGFPTWTKAELEADDGANATWLKTNADPEDLDAIRKLIAGMNSGAMDTTTADEIDLAAPWQE